MATDIEKTILEKIKAGEISKRPRAYFALQVAAIATLAMLALVLSLFTLSFIIFSVHESGEQLLLGFGRQGMLTFFELFPWLTLGLVVLLFVVLEWLVRNFRSGYSVPMVRIFLIIAVVAAAGSVILDFTPLHAALLGMADRDSLPFIGEAYEQVHDPHEAQGVYRGDVIAIATTTFTCAHSDHDHDTDDGTWVVEPPQGFDMQSLYMGERIYVAGREGPGGIVEAYGVHPF